MRAPRPWDTVPPGNVGVMTPAHAAEAAGSGGGVGPSHLHKKCQSFIPVRRDFGAGAWTVAHGPYRGMLGLARWWCEIRDSLKDRNGWLRNLF